MVKREVYLADGNFKRLLRLCNTKLWSGWAGMLGSMGLQPQSPSGNSDQHRFLGPPGEVLIGPMPGIYIKIPFLDLEPWCGQLRKRMSQEEVFSPQSDYWGPCFALSSLHSPSSGRKSWLPEAVLPRISTKEKASGLSLQPLLPLLSELILV